MSESVYLCVLCGSSIFELQIALALTTEDVKDILTDASEMKMHTDVHYRLGVTQLLTMSYTEFGMLSDALSALQFASTRVLVVLSRVSAPLSGSAAIPSSSQPLR